MKMTTHIMPIKEKLWDNISNLNVATIEDNFI